MLNENCPCTKKCERHGHCDECRAHHIDMKAVPFCERPSKEEKRVLREKARAERKEQRKNR